MQNEYDMLSPAINTGAWYVRGRFALALLAATILGLARRFGPEFPDAADDHRGAVRRWQRARPDRAHPRLAARRKCSVSRS